MTPLEGKRFAMLGYFHRDCGIDAEAARRGMTHVGLDDDAPDYLFLGEHLRKRQEAEAKRLRRRYPDAVVLAYAEAARMLRPAHGEFVAELLADAPHPIVNRWATLARICGERFRGDGLDLRGRNLWSFPLFALEPTRCDFGGANLSDGLIGAEGHPARACNFDGADLSGATLKATEDCTFRGANLRRANLEMSSHLCGDFGGADLSAAKFTGAEMTSCVFRGADLRGAGYVATKPFHRCDFGGADLSNLHAPGGRFAACAFAGADLRDADLRKASLVGADLRDADLRGASMGGADLTGAAVAGADFTGADVRGATLAGVDPSRAKGVGPTEAPAVGPALRAFAAAVAGKKFSTAVEAAAGSGRLLTCTAWPTFREDDSPYRGTTRMVEGEEHRSEYQLAPSLPELMLALARRYTGTEVRLDTVKVDTSSKRNAAAWTEPAVAAWAEAFGIDPEAVEGMRRESAERADADRSAFVADLRERGAKAWDELDSSAKERRADLRGADLSGGRLSSWRDEYARINLSGANLAGADLREAGFRFATLDGASFARADMREAGLGYSSAKKADFAGANLTRAYLGSCDLRGASFRDADLSFANFTGAKLQGADFTGAGINRAEWDRAEYDGSTVFPAGFVPPAAMVRTDVPRIVPVHPDGMTYDDFVAMLQRTFADRRVEQALLMARVPRYRLFAEVEDGRVLGVVRSKSSRAMLYACYLADGGGHGCVSGSRARCGGLRGGPCKHILSLTIRQVFDGSLAATTAANRVERGRDFKAPPDAQVLHETLERYAAQE